MKKNTFKALASTVAVDFGKHGLLNMFSIYPFRLQQASPGPVGACTDIRNYNCSSMDRVSHFGYNGTIWNMISKSL